MTVVTAEDLAAVALPRTGYRPAVEYLAEALRGQGKAIATTVDTHLTNAQVLNLAGAIDRAVAKALREQLAQVAADVLAMQAAEVDCEAVEHERAPRSNCPPMCPCLCHDGFGGAHHGQRCAEPQLEWHYAYLGMEYRHVGKKADCDACARWQLPAAAEASVGRSGA